MTLSTDILIHGPVSQSDVFAEVNRILGIPDERVLVDEVEGDTRRLSNRIGQGFPAIVDTYARVDGAETQPEAHDAGEWACDVDCDYWRHVGPAYNVRVDLDTAYGYNVAGEDCNTLHARVIVGLHKWLGERGGSLHWVNEYTSDVNEGLDGMASFIHSGDQAQGWFRNEVAPLIAAMGARA